MFTKPTERRVYNAYRLERLADIVNRIADVDERLAKSFAETRQLADDIKRLEYQNDADHDERNHIIKAVVGKREVIEAKLQERQQLVQWLLKAVGQTNAKGMKELKEDLGLIAPPPETATL